MDHVLHIVQVEDDENDAHLFVVAMRHARVKATLQRVKNGREAIEYLEGRGGYSDRAKYPAPDVIVLDLKLPVMSGLGFLLWRKESREYSRVPVVVLTSSTQDIEECMQLGANRYFVKPGNFQDFIDTVSAIGEVGILLRESSGQVSSPEELRKTGARSEVGPRGVKG